jgi:hypothetical protein
MSVFVTPQQAELLTSWKEIAAYLGKGVRTVQRWEQQYGLPVRRPNEKVKGIVHATRPELDRWLASQWSQRPREFGHVRHLDDVQFQALHASIKDAELLRARSRILLEDMKSSLKTFQAQCEVLARNINLSPPGGQTS